MGEIVDDKPSSDVEGSNKDKATLANTFHPDAEDRLAAASTAQSPKPAAVKAVKNAKKDKEQVLSNQSSSSASSMIGLLALLGALVALVGVAYLWNESRVEKAKLAYENNSLESELNSQRAQVATLQSSLEALQKDLAATQGYAEVVQSESGEISGRVNAIEGQIAEMTGASRVDWMLKEVEHFVMVAERRLSLLGDVDGALALVMEADELVRDMAEPAARPLRTAIQKDLQTLTAASDVAVDTEGLFAQISLLNEKVAALKSDSIAYEMSLPAANAEASVPAAGLEYAWYELKQFVKSLVRVQRVTDGEIKPLLLKDQQVFVEQNIQLLLEQAQMGLLRGDQAVYSASLNEAANRVRTYLRTNTGEAEAFLTKLSDLSAATVQPDVPSIEGSVRAVKVFRDFWQQEKIERQVGRNAIEAATEPAPAAVQ